MKTITFANYTGGAGKSTSSSSMATILAKKGFKTLFIDADKQRNSTSYMASEEGAVTIYDVIDRRRPLNDIHLAIQHCDTCDVIAGDGLLDTLNSQLNVMNSKEPHSGTYALRKSLETIADEYDFCVIDTSYIVDEILNTVFAATDYIIVPMDVDAKAIQGLIALNDDICEIKKVNPNIRIIGCLLTRVNANKRARNTNEFYVSANSTAKLLNTKVYETRIRTAEVVRQSHNNGQPLILAYPTSTVAQDYDAFVDEFIADLNNSEGGASNAL